MNRQWSGQLKVAVALCCVALLAACTGTPPIDSIRGALIIVGSGSQQSEISVWGDAWVKENNGVSVNFSPDGEDIGLQALQSGNTYVATSDSPLTVKDSEAAIGSCGPAGAFALPTSIAPVGVVYNLSGLRGLKLDAPALAGIFSGNIDTWNDPKLQALNPLLRLPAKAIVPVTSEANSALTVAGTTYLSGDAGVSWPSNPSGNWPEDSPGEKVEFDKDVAKKVDDKFGTIAFMDVGTIGNRFSTASLKFSDGFVTPTSENIDSAIVNSKVTLTGQGVGVDLAWDQGTGYQMASVKYQVFCSQYSNEAIATLVRSWAKFVVSEPGQSRAWVALSSYSPNLKALQAAQVLAASIDYSR